MNVRLAIIAAALACGGALAEPPRAVRGLVSHLDVEYGPALRAKASQSPTSPVLVRVGRRDGPTLQRLEFIGAVAGEFDLRDYVERVDGRAMSDLAPLPVVVVSKLPAEHGTDLYGSAPGAFDWRMYYRELLWGAGVLWLAVPVAALIVRAMRKPVVVTPPPPSPVLTLADELRAMLALGAQRPLTVDERGRLELLVFRVLTERGTTDLQSKVRGTDREIAELRAHPETRELVLAIERWLHTREPGADDHARASAALEEFRAAHLAKSAGAGVSP